MKKAYINPTVSKMEFSVKNTILTGSYNVAPDQETNEVLSKKRGWNADLWTAEDEE